MTRVEGHVEDSRFSVSAIYILSSRVAMGETFRTLPSMNERVLALASFMRRQAYTVGRAQIELKAGVDMRVTRVT